jgi:hypothetical protein
VVGATNLNDAAMSDGEGVPAHGPAISSPQHAGRLQDQIPEGRLLGIVNHEAVHAVLILQRSRVGQRAAGVVWNAF